MIRFLGGPAAGVTMQLRRAPLFLRVTQTLEAGPAEAENGYGFDALDMLGDEPNRSESVTVYKREGPRTVVHIDFARGRKRNCSGWYVVATYRHFDAPPGEEVLRNTAAWQAWCHSQIAPPGAH